MFTAPDGIFMKQDDAPTVDPNAGKSDEGDQEGEEEQSESYMYFIRTG